MNTKKIVCLFAALAAALCCLNSCAAREFFATLGFDTHDYDGETVTQTYESDSEKAAELGETVKTLTMGSVNVPEFDGTNDAIDHCRDSLLNYMLNSGFVKYTGNIELLEEAAEAYPKMRFSVIIPAKDFSDEAYKYFGGKEKVANVSGEMFEYLDKIECYVTAAQPQKNDIVVNVISLEETENTYRMRFNCTLGDETGDTYFALMIKRADDSYYFKYVKKA